jgi:hypothetical protein
LSESVLTGFLFTQAIGEQAIAVVPASNVITLDVTTGSVFYCSTEPTANFTVNITGLPSTSVDNKDKSSFTICLIYQSAFYGNTTSAVDDTLATVVASGSPIWNGGVLPDVSASTINIQTFTIVRVFSTSSILSTVTSFSAAV